MFKIQPRWESVAFATTFYNEESIVSDDSFWLIVAQSLVQTLIKKTLLNDSLKLSKLPLFRPRAYFMDTYDDSRPIRR